MFGSFLAYTEIRKVRNFEENSYHSLASFIGLLLILFPLLFYNDKIFHPSFFTLLPIVGVSLVIYFTRYENNFIKKLLSQKLIVGIGLISYSLYLWHYPIFAFGRINQNYDITSIHKIFWIIIILSLSIFSYFLIEKPFRDKNLIKRKFLFKSLMFTSLIIIIFNFSILNNDGYKKRFDHLSKIYGIIEFDNNFLAEESLKYLKEFNPFEDNNKIKTLIVGDSHSKDIFNCFYQNTNLFPKYQFRRLGYDNNTRLKISAFHPREKQEYKNQMIKLITSNPNFLQSEIVVISIKFSQKAIDALPNFIMFLREFNKEIVLLSRSNDYEILEAPTRTQVDIKLLEIFKNSDEFNSGHRKNLEKLMYNKRRVNKYANINIQLSKISKGI